MSHPWRIDRGTGPLVAAAIHDGHAVRDELIDLLEIGEAARLQEEDPFTGLWTSVVPTRVVGQRSRFEVDLNRPRKRAVYIEPDDAWGLQVWKNPPAAAVVERSLAVYDAFYAEMKELLSDVASTCGHFVVLDLHSYNHRREGPAGPAADPEGNPEVNVGTGTIDRAQWGPLIDRFIADLSGFDFLGRHLDVRENVKFRGGHLSTWAHERFAGSGCVLAIEFKKFFMDEWTGEPDRRQVDAIGDALKATVPGILEELAKL